MIPKEILEKVRKIEITTRSLVNELFSGEYHSIFKGQGLEFSEVRAYQPGDNVKLIDWNVTARFGHPYIKKFEETRELTVMLMIDVSGSGNFGTARNLKREIAAELGAILAFSAIRNNDKVGLMLFSDEVEQYIPPKKGKKSVLRIVREILYHKAEHKKTNISEALKYYYKMSKKKSIVFVISDFLDEDFLQTMKILSQKHDVIASRILDPKELEIPKLGHILVEDTETGKEILINTNSREFQTNFINQKTKKIDQLETDLKRFKIDLIDIQADQPYIKKLIRFFKQREKRLR